MAYEEGPQLDPNAFTARVQVESHISIQYTSTQAMANSIVVPKELVPTYDVGCGDHGPSTTTDASGWAEESIDKSYYASNHLYNGKKPK